jgi:hypothetical protein
MELDARASQSASFVPRRWQALTVCANCETPAGQAAGTLVCRRTVSGCPWDAAGNSWSLVIRSMPPVWTDCARPALIQRNGKCANAYAKIRNARAGRINLGANGGVYFGQAFEFRQANSPSLAIVTH